MEDISKPFKKLKRRIKKFVSHPLDYRKENSVYLNFNKSYKKFNWDKSSYSKSEVRDILEDKLFRNVDSIIKHSKDFDTKKRDNILYISRDSLEEEFLRREMCAYVDDKMWKRNAQERKKKKFKTGPTKEYYLRGIGKKFYMGKLPLKMDKKIKIIKEFLLKKKYIFDRKSNFYLNPKVIRNLISRKLLYGAENKFNDFLAQVYENN